MEELQPGRQHQGDAPARANADAAQTGGDLACRRQQSPVSQGVGLRRAALKQHMRPLGMSPHMPLQYLDQCRGTVRVALFQWFRCLPRGPVTDRFRRSRCSGGDSHEQIARCFRRAQHIVAEANVKSLFEARQEFHARQAVQAEVLVQRTVQRRPGAATATHFGDQRIDDGQQLRRVIGRRSRLSHSLNRRVASADFLQKVQQPFHSGLRFCMKASMPSAASWAIMLQAMVSAASW